uniref:T-cell surface antigen CD2 n=1 Tax=Castor canadensis TaxID=51338 RepID=A0A8C0ZNU2_CASCN
MVLRVKVFESQHSATILLFTGAVSQDPRTIWGALGQDIILETPGSQPSDAINEIRWEKEGTMVAQMRKDKRSSQQDKSYEILNEGLKIKHLKRNDGGTYNVTVYDTGGKSVLQRAFDLRIQEMVSKPKISWDCRNTTLTCETEKGTDPQLKLFQSEKELKTGTQKVIRYKWANLNAAFKCTASNRINEESSMAAISCSEKGLSMYVIIGTCGGGVLLLIFVSLLIFHLRKRKKQSSRRNGEQLEIKAHRMTSEERGPRPHQMPASQPPPPPLHRSQAPSQRPLPPGHRVQNQQKKRPLPTGTQVHQQKGPPLPRPRVQPKPPSGDAENTMSPSSS